MQDLYNIGWLFIGPIKTSRDQGDMNALYFRQDTSLMENKEQAKFFALSLNKNDRIRLINAPDQLTNSLRVIITDTWPKGIQEFMNLIYTYPSWLFYLGIQEEFVKIGEHEFKLKGNPWWCDYEDTIFSRRLMCNIFQILRQYYYSLYGTCELSMQLNSKSIFFFRYDPSILNRPSFCVSLDDMDKFRIIDGNLNHIDTVSNVIMGCWDQGIQEQKNYKGSYIFKLNGYPFSGSAENSVYASVILMNLLSSYQKQGVDLLCSASVSGKFHSDKNATYKIDLSAYFWLY